MQKVSSPPEHWEAGHHPAIPEGGYPPTCAAVTDSLGAGQHLTVDEAGSAPGVVAEGAAWNSAVVYDHRTANCHQAHSKIPVVAARP